MVHGDTAHVEKMAAKKKQTLSFSETGKQS